MKYWQTPEYKKQYRREYYLKNKDKAKARYAGYKEERSEYNRALNLSKKYGMTLEQYSEMLAAQNGVCKICKKDDQGVDPRTNKQKPLAVDHCHATGRVRGLLCSGCNGALGLFKDNQESLNNAITYLREYQCA